MSAAALPRIVAAIVAVPLLAAAAVLFYIAAIAFRRDEGVFMPAGYVAALCLGGAVLLLRIAMRG